jgi:hypothetical protein
MSLSVENLNLATQFFLGNTEMLDKKDEDFKNWFITYASDNNSSTVREAVTLHYLGYESYEAKHGADGFDPNTGRQKEVKPKFVTEGNKVSSSGNFNDMTMELLEKKKDLDVICSLFSGNRLIYIVEFPISVINEKLKQPIINAKIGRRVVCPFNYMNYDSDELIVHYLDVDTMKSHNCLPKNHMMMLESRNKKNEKVI